MTLPEDRAVGALWAFRFEAGRGVFVADQAQRDCLTPPEGGFSWMHFPLSDQRARLFLERFDLIPAAAKTMLLGAEHRLQLHAAEGWVYGVLADLERDFEGKAVDIGRLYFAMNPSFMVTVRRHALQGADEVRRMIENGVQAATSPDLFVMLVEHFIDMNEARQQELTLEIDSLEDRVLGFQGDPSRWHVGPIRRELSRQHREFLALRGAFQRGLFHRGQSQHHLVSDRLPALIAQIEDFDRDAADLLERARLLHEEIGEQVSATTNRNLRVLTILSTLMLPPTLIVGAFGMNVEGIPWAHDVWGFAEACGLCIGVVVAAWLGLKIFNILR
ncbi:MAG: CorA family divalent cation transporter [Terricaulis silvestris]